MSDRDRINVRCVLVKNADREAEWAVHYTNDGLTICRPSVRLYVPYELTGKLARALRQRPESEKP